MPVEGLQASSVQALVSSQTLGLPPTQMPLAQVSVWVQAFQSVQALVLSLVKTQDPVAGLQESSVQALVSLQTLGLLPTQAPAAQVSTWVQALPSEQVLVLSLTAAQVPVAGLQASSVQGLVSSQALGLLPTQVPAAQVSVWVQELPSEQVLVLSLVAAQAPVAGLQASSVQAFKSSQTLGLLPWQMPAAQVSVWVQELPSEQVLVSSLTAPQAPVAGSQVSSVQALVSSQALGLLPTQMPAAQLSV